MKKYLALLIFGFCLNAYAEQKATVFVGESNFSIDGSSETFSKESLLQELKKRSLDSVILAVDVCAGPVQVADAYVVLQQLNIMDVELKGVGELKSGGCGNV